MSKQTHHTSGSCNPPAKPKHRKHHHSHGCTHSGSMSGSNVFTGVLVGSGTVHLARTGSFSVPAAGASGVGFFTGSVPSPAINGAVLAVTDTLGLNPWLLTGSMGYMRRPVFTRLSPAASGSSITVSPGGSVELTSDGCSWCVTSTSGSITLA